MPKSAGQILGGMGWDAVPFGIGTGVFFALDVAEIGILAGIGAGFALTGLGVIGTLAIPVGVLLALGDNGAAAELADAIHEATSLLSPGVMALLPVSPFITPHDPTLFAKAVGPAFDLGTGAFSGGTIERLGAQASALAGFEGWKSDVISLGNEYLSGQTSPGSGSSPNPSGGRPTAGPSPAQPPNSGSGNAGGFPFDFNVPGGGDMQSANSTSNSFSDIPVGTSVININDLNIPGISESGGSSDAQTGDTSAGTPPSSDNTGGSDETGGQDAGTPSGGDGQTNPGSGAGPSPGSGDGSPNEGGEGDGGGGGDGGD